MPYDVERRENKSKSKDKDDGRREKAGQLGLLRLTATNQVLAYQIFELSACTLGIISREALSPRDYLELEHPLQRVPLRVMPAPPGQRSPERDQSSDRYRLICLDPALELDRLLLQNQPERPLHLSNFQYARFELQPKLYVEIVDPISQTPVLFEALNISRSGMLLRSSGPGTQPEPYVGCAAVQLQLDVAKLWLPRLTRARCRIVRVYTERLGNQLHTCLGVQFTHFDAPGAHQWHELLAGLEKTEIPGSLCIRPAWYSQK